MPDYATPLREQVARALGWTDLKWDEHHVVLWGIFPDSGAAVPTPRWELDYNAVFRDLVPEIPGPVSIFQALDASWAVGSGAYHNARVLTRSRSLLEAICRAFLEVSEWAEN